MHWSCLPVILQSGRPAGLSFTQDNKALRVWPCTPQQKAWSQHEHGATCLGECRVLKANVPFLFRTHVAGPICDSLSLSFNVVFVKHTTEIKHAQAYQKHRIRTHRAAQPRHRATESQSAALAFQHEWWFSRSTIRWEEQEVSAGWFSASISYKGGHFSSRRMTYEGTAAAFISILLWGMVAKVSLYLL